MGKPKLVSKSESCADSDKLQTPGEAFTEHSSASLGWKPLGYKNAFPVSAVPQRNPIPGSLCSPFVWGRERGRAGQRV